MVFYIAIYILDGKNMKYHRGMEIIKKVKEIKNRNKNNKYDVVLGVSGGRDSTSYIIQKNIGT